MVVRVSILRHLASLALAGGLLGGCSCKDEKAKEAAAAVVDPEVLAGDQPASGGGTDTPPPAPPPVEPGFALTRVGPEQLSNNIVQATGFDALLNDDNDTGQRLDYLLITFGIPLGGIDFTTAARRDPTTKAQTLLVSRVVAWELAQAAVWADHERAVGAQRMFVKCQLKTDRPWRNNDRNLSSSDQEDVRAGELRWWLQVDEMFFRLYSRPPTTAERTAVQTAFDTAMTEQQYPPSAWVVVLYAMLASQEFWHL